MKSAYCLVAREQQCLVTMVDLPEEQLLPIPASFPSVVPDNWCRTADGGPGAQNRWWLGHPS